MGVTVDLIPRLPDETPEQAIARIYDGGVAIVYDGETKQMYMEHVGDDEPIEPALAGAFDEWQAEVLRRLRALHDWQSEIVDGHPHLWSAGFGWQVELNGQDITLRARRGGGDGTLEDETFLAAFEGLRTILHWPDDHGSYFDLDDPDDVPETIG